jgi:hypothetical protein
MNNEPKRDLGWVMILLHTVSAIAVFGFFAWMFMTMGDLAK